jgi:lysylphosphatidylglycerol synthetase-like protein (DUF2156 family)
MKRLTRHPIVVFVAFWALFLLLLRSGSSSADLFVRAAIWAAILTMSGIAIFKMVWHRRMDPHGQDATMPDRIRRWVLDEHDDTDRRRTR